MTPYYIIIIFILSRGIYSYKSLDNIRSNAAYTDGGTNGVCGDNLCFCVLSKADCFGFRNPSRYIPKLPYHITEINFKDNYLPVINSNTMTNVSHLNLTTLSLINNNVIRISSDAFKYLRSLRALTFGKDPRVNVNEVANTLSNLKYSLRRVAFIEMGWKYLPESMFENVPELRKIRISSRIEVIEIKTLSVLRYLNSLDLNNNLLVSFDMQTTVLQELKKLNLVGNRLSHVPGFCNTKTQKSLLPKLLELNLWDNKIYELTNENFKCLPGLQKLFLQRNHVTLLGNNFISSLPSLRILDLTGIASNRESIKIEQFALNSSTLKELRIMDLDSKFFSSYGITSLFSNCRNLHTLLLCNSYISLHDDNLVLMFSPLTNLQTLDLSESRMAFLPDTLFSGMTSFTELSLRSNIIRSWNGSRLFGNYNMSYLDLSDNKISIINETSFPSSMLKYMEYNYDHNKVESLDLSRNPYLCTCQSLNSINWLRTHSNILKNYPYDYNCFLPPDVKDMKLKDYNPSPESCAEKDIALLVSVPVSIISISTLSVIFLVYKCRWRLRFGIYMFKNRYRNYEQIEGLDRFVYQGFVIYSDEDRDWVHNEFIHRIEDQEGFRLCIRLRDFDVGKVHVDNIVENMLMSEKIIVVLSNNFAKDDWCQFQLLLAETRLLKQNVNMLVLLMLEEIQSDCLRASLYQLVTERQYALWSQDETGNDLFWEQSLSQLRRPTVIT